MTTNSRQNNIYNKVSVVYPKKTDLWKMNLSAKEYVKKKPSSTMNSLYIKFNSCDDNQGKLNILSQMFNLYHTYFSIPLTTKEYMENKKLVYRVFSYYRNKFSDNTLLLHEAFGLSIFGDIQSSMNKKLEYIIDSKLWINLVVASTQSGKTFLMFALCNIYMSLGYTPVFIVKDLWQKEQFLQRQIEDSILLQKFLKAEGFSENLIKIFDKSVYCDSEMSVKKQDTAHDSIIASINKSSIKCIICIAHYKHLERVYNCIESNSSIILFTDEAHKLGAYKRITEDTETTTIIDNSKSPLLYDNLYLKIKIHSQKIILFTATPQNILVIEPELYPKGIVLMKECKEYRGVESWIFNIIPPSKNEEYLEYLLTEIPISFLQTMSRLSLKEPIKRINKFGIKDTHPILLMVKFEVTNDGQKLLLDSLKKDNPVILNEDHKIIVDSGWGGIVMNQLGLRFYHSSLIGQKITINNKTYYDNLGEFLFPKSISIGSLWHWCWENGGVSRFPRLVTFAYKSAEEGITFSSVWTNNPKTCANWHITNIYSRMGTNSAAANIEQSLGRANGNHGDNINPEIDCPLIEKEKLIFGVNLHREQLNNICDIKLNHGDDKVIKHIHGYEVFSNRVPKNYYGEIKDASSTIVPLKNPDEQMETSIMLHDKSSENIFYIVNPTYDGGKRRKTEIDFYNFNTDNKVKYHAKNEDISNKIQNIKKILLKNTKLSRFLLSINTSNLYTRNQLINLLEKSNYEQPKSIFTSITSKNSTFGPGCLFENIDNKWKICNNLSNAFN